MRNLPDYYKILKVQPDAPIEIIRASYRTLMRELKVHPDLGGSTETAALLNEAYEVLSDGDRRADYDRRLSLQSGAQAAAGKQQERLPACPFCKHVLPRRALPGDCCPTCDSPVRSQEMASLEEASRRSVSRMKRDDVLLFYTAWPQKGREGRLIDLSPRGLRFVSGEMLNQWSVIKVSAATFEALAAVTNIHVAPDSGEVCCSVGASFIAVKFEGSKGTFLSARA